MFIERRWKWYQDDIETSFNKYIIAKFLSQNEDWLSFLIITW